jgi:ferritin-like protein
MTQMHAFERVLRPGIPFADAVGFFHRVKTAGWADPPDESGLLEGQFQAPIEQVIQQLTVVTAAKFKLMVAYHVYAESMRGLAQHAISEIFHEHAEQERAAAEAYLKRAAALGGGPVHLPEIETPPASADPVGILMVMARAEQEGIAAQHELKLLVGEDNPLSFQIEQYMIEDQHHLDEVWQLLPADAQRTPVIDTKPAGVTPEVPEEEEDPAAQPAPPDSTAEKEPSAAKKVAFARALGLLFKQAGKASDIINSVTPEEKAKLLEEVKSQGRKDALPLLGRRVAGGAKTLGREVAKSRVGFGLGGLLGAAGGANMSEHHKKKLRAGGPVGRFTAEHPALMGGLQTAVVGGGAHAAIRHHSVPGIAASIVGPGLALKLTDSALKKREQAKQEQAKQAAVNFQLALQKLGFAPPEPGQGTDPGAAPIPGDDQMTAPVASMEQPGEQPPMATEPGMAGFDPVNYLEAEETGRRAQESNEAAFYRTKAQEASGQVQNMSGQIQQVQSQLDQLSQQAAESQQQILAANQEAATANDQMLNQATLAARMRMGMQQLRAQMMEIASQDPEQLAAAAGGPTPMDVGQQAAAAGQPAGAPPGGAPPGAPGEDPNAAPTGLNGETEVTGDPNGAADPGAQAGAPGAAPSAGAPPGSPPGGAGSPDGGSAAPEEPQKASEGPDKKKDSAETTVSIKKGSVNPQSIVSEMKGALPYLAGGGVIGAGKSYMDAKSGKDIPIHQQQVDVLKDQQDGSFGKSIELAKAQLQLGHAQEAHANPGRAALRGGIGGAALAEGLHRAVPAAINEAKTLKRGIDTLRK